MKIQKIYDKYKIMPQLQLHQLRVAGVASIICDNFRKDIDKDSVVTAALLHDMGNILKFDFEFTRKTYPQVFEDKRVSYWMKIQKDLSKKYGTDEHNATYKIAEEIGVIEPVLNIINNVGYIKGMLIAKSEDFSIKIVAYSDQRVSPTGVDTLTRRLNEGKKRFLERIKQPHSDVFYEMSLYWQKIEEQIFHYADIAPNDINNKKVLRLIDNLREYEIETR